MATTSLAQTNYADEFIIERVLAGETAMYELLVRRYNQRLYRVVRSIVRDDDLAEDIMQEAYVRAFQHLNQFQGRSSFSTWLSRIAIHEALARMQQRTRTEQHDFDAEDETVPVTPHFETPESVAATRESRELLEQAILTLPQDYRMVLIMRDVEEVSTADTAAALQLTEETVKVRLHRARAKLRRKLFTMVGATSTQAFQFHAVRCDRVWKAVEERIK